MIFFWHLFCQSSHRGFMNPSLCTTPWWEPRIPSWRFGFFYGYFYTFPTSSHSVMNVDRSGLHLEQVCVPPLASSSVWMERAEPERQLHMHAGCIRRCHVGGKNKQQSFDVFNLNVKQKTSKPRPHQKNNHEIVYLKNTAEMCFYFQLKSLKEFK